MAAATARWHLPADIPEPRRLAAALGNRCRRAAGRACDRADRPRLPRSFRSPGPRRRGPRAARAGAGRPRHLDEAQDDPPGARPARRRPGLPRRGGGAPPLAHPAPPGRHERPLARVRWRIAGAPLQGKADGRLHRGRADARHMPAPHHPGLSRRGEPGDPRSASGRRSLPLGLRQRRAALPSRDHRQRPRRGRIDRVGLHHPAGRPAAVPAAGGGDRDPALGRPAGEPGEGRRRAGPPGPRERLLRPGHRDHPHRPGDSVADTGMADLERARPDPRSARPGRPRPLLRRPLLAARA